MAVKVVGLFIYPVKSLRGIEVSEATIERRGFQFDRRWMVVDKDGQFVTQRELPSMARIATSLESGVITLSEDAHGSMEIPLSLADGPRRQVTVWGDSCEAIAASSDASQWLSGILGGDYEIVYMPDSSERRIEAEFSNEGEIVGFTDGFPFLLTTIPSLADLNSRLRAPVPMSRFRPNIVVDGNTPFEEDSWKEIRIGEIPFRVVKPCGRCVIITTDQQTGARNKEVLSALATFRAVGKNVMFGQNLIHDSKGVLRTGDPISVQRIEKP